MSSNKAPKIPPTMHIFAMATSADSANKIGFDVRYFKIGSGFQIPFEANERKSLLLKKWEWASSHETHAPRLNRIASCPRI